MRFSVDSLGLFNEKGCVLGAKVPPAWKPGTSKRNKFWAPEFFRTARASTPPGFPTGAHFFSSDSPHTGSGTKRRGAVG